MPIFFDGNNNIFTIQTKNTSYIFKLYKETPKYEGATERCTLRSVYWGKKVERKEEIAEIAKYVSLAKE